MSGCYYLDIALGERDAPLPAEDLQQDRDPLVPNAPQPKPAAKP
jgi:hypothetical protein